VIAMSRQVQGAKVLVGDLRSQLDGELGDGLADVTVVLNDLTDGEARVQELAAVNGGAGTELVRARIRIHPQARRELIEEERHAVRHLDVGRMRCRPAGELVASSRDDHLTVGRDELVQHGATIPRMSRRRTRRSEAWRA
jgi:hypothetical protein